jgi:hypothetical protein
MESKRAEPAKKGSIPAMLAISDDHVPSKRLVVISTQRIPFVCTVAGSWAPTLITDSSRQPAPPPDK